jgi:hypothetical protein
MNYAPAPYMLCLCGAPTDADWQAHAVITANIDCSSAPHHTTNHHHAVLYSDVQASKVLRCNSCTECCSAVTNSLEPCM